jgi:hypothetical protein
MNPKQMAKRLAELGRGDDTLLAHINQREAAMLKRAGGSGKTNPKTGIVEFDDGGADGYTTGVSAPAPSTPFNFTDTPAPQMTPAPADFNPSVFSGLADPPAGTGQSSPGNFSFLDNGGFAGDPFGGLDVTGVDTGLPAATPREGVGNMQGLGPQGFSDYAMNFIKRFGMAKGTQLAFKFLGIPGAAMSLAGPAKAAWDAPSGQGTEAFFKSLGIGAGNQVMNNATGGLFGAMGGSISNVAGKGNGSPAPQGSQGSSGSGSGSYNPNVDYARGALGLAGAARFAYLGRSSEGERAASDQLGNLMKNPGDVTKLPGFAAGQQAVERASAGRGYLGSGNLTVALSKYGDTFYNNAVNTFSNVANANSAVRNNYNTNATALALQSLGSLGYGYMRSKPNNPSNNPELMGPPDQAFSDLNGWEG